jgi:hypothetical protein
MSRIPSDRPSPADVDREANAVRTASALLKMPEGDKRELLAGIRDPLEHEPATAVDDALLGRNAGATEAAVERNQQRIAVHDFLSAIKAEGFSLPALKQSVEALRIVYARDRLSLEQGELLSRQLEVLQDLDGERDLRNVTSPKLREAILTLGSPDFAELVRSAHAGLVAALGVEPPT